MKTLPTSPNTVSLSPTPTSGHTSPGSPSASVTSTAPTALPSDEEVEAVIKQATSTIPTPDGRPPPGKDTRTQLFAGNLPYRVRWQDLKDLFRRAGTVLRADVSLSPDNRSRGYGTVLLASAEDAGRAVDMFNGYNWQGRVLEVRLDRLGAVPGADMDANPAAIIPGAPLPGLPIGVNINGLNASLGGIASVALNGVHLPFHCQWQDLKDLFRQAGTILRADVSLGPDGRSRGFGTVTYANEIDAERAVAMFNGYALLS
ncbi:RNA-binding domain-containing protein [Fomitiporia mediterranea MF3/22]|uniref:RNA-binding domain-containing protein n=1 Tax=Fomitiporia mediterranea (strain MF3/22) TaxID=694068 RepID=UPI0004409B69|nr:RNA-binding domain-containing protein [Fomitiporia mediterranea MF3/22]EJC99311.1 RNA-binding domain-containing protein [Fomitiporia mediterranea MF3/22]